MGRRKVAICQKLKVLTLLQVLVTHDNIRNQVGVSNGCIKILKKKKDRYLLNLMKKDREKTSRRLAFEWNSSNGKSIIPETVSRWLFNDGYKSYTSKQKPY
jgi:hypothetical protein